MKFGIVVFPGTWSERDMAYAVGDVLGYEFEFIWHKQSSIIGYDAILLPGGFSYGDYLRCGAIARFSPVMEAVRKFAADGGLVFGSCNGFQVLCEAGLLPGALIRNNHMEFRCSNVNLRIETSKTPFTSLYTQGSKVVMPISHGEGNYQAEPDTIHMLENEGRIIFRYVDNANNATHCANPNGSVNNIAGIINQQGNVLGMMPHPERACETLIGSDHGNPLWQSIANHTTGTPLIPHVLPRQSDYVHM